MPMPAQDEMQEAMEEALVQFAAALSNKLPDELSDEAEVWIELANRSAKMTVEESGMKAEKEMFAGSLWSKVEKEAQQAGNGDLQKGLKELEATREYEVSPSEQEEAGSGEEQGAAATVKEKISGS